MSAFFPALPPFFIQPGFGEMPVGAVVAFAGNAGGAVSASPPIPSINVESMGWMVCDGRLLRCDWYPQLYAVLGNLYGSSEQHFRLPDYQGYFLRGLDSLGGPDAGTRTDPDGGPGHNQGIGSRQQDALKMHENIYNSAPAPAAPSSSGSAAGAPAGKPALTQDGPTDNLLPPGGVRVSATETRPRNIYVSYLIKFTYGLRQQPPFLS